MLQQKIDGLAFALLAMQTKTHKTSVPQFCGTEIFIYLEKNIMNQKEQITFHIENFLRDYVEKEIELTALQISKWPVVSSICTNSNIKNICTAMKEVNSNYEVISGKEESTTYKIKYKK